MLRYTLISIIPVLYNISTHVWSHTMVGIGIYIRKQMIMIRLLGWAPNYSRFVSFSMVPSEVNAESEYMFGSDCFVVTATRDINVNDRIILYGPATNGYVVESRGSLCKL